MKRPDTVFADNGGRTLRRYRGGRATTETTAWRGMCVESWSWSRSGTSCEHVFADGRSLLRDPRARLGRAALRRADRLLDELVEPPEPPRWADITLRALADRPQVTLAWAGVRQRVAVGDADRLVTDERRLCTVEISAASGTAPPWSEVVRWDETDAAIGLGRVESAIVRVRRWAARPVTPLPPGGFDIVLAPGRAGPFFHELLGHPLEADIVAGGSSYLSGRFGDLIAPGWLAVTDGPPPPGEGTGATVDDEGTPISPVRLIDRGRVTGMLSDVPAAVLTGSTSSGHGRRIDYRHPVIPRMWHTAAVVQNAPPEPPGAARLSPSGMRLRWMNLLTGDFEFAIEGASLDDGTGPLQRTGPCSLSGNALTVLAALRPGPAGSLPGGRASKGCGKLGQFPLVTTFANSGMWIPAEAVRVHDDPRV